MSADAHGENASFYRVNSGGKAKTVHGVWTCSYLLLWDQLLRTVPPLLSIHCTPLPGISSARWGVGNQSRSQDAAVELRIRKSPFRQMHQNDESPLLIRSRASQHNRPLRRTPYNFNCPDYPATSPQSEKNTNVKRGEIRRGCGLGHVGGKEPTHRYCWHVRKPGRIDKNDAAD